jgi:tetratricopeptide (TPR) repeat protein
MKKIFLSVLFVSVSALGQSKKNEKGFSNQTNFTFDKDIIAYREAVRLKDLSSASVYLNYIIQDEKNKTYLDTLALVYLNRGMYFSSYEITSKLEKEQTSTFRKEILAVSSRELNKIEESIGWYKAVYQEVKSPGILYELAQLLYINNNIDEARLAVTQLLIDLKDDEEATVNVQKGDGKSTQIIKFKALVWYMYAAILKESKDTVSEKAAYESALKLSPDYELAQLALSKM